MLKTIIAVFLTLFCAPSFAQNLVLNCGATVDVVSGKLTGPKSFAVSEQRITSASELDDAKTIDLSDSTCLPGLIDMHVHLTSQSSPRSYIERFTLNTADSA